MAEENLQIQIDQINKKLDFITEELYAQRSHRKSMEDLQADLTKISSSTIQFGSQKLEDISQYFSIDDLSYLLKKALLNINNLTKLFDMIENIMDFYESFAPLTKEMMTTIQVRLEQFGKSNYFDLIKILKNRMDILMQSASKEELNILGNNIVAFLLAAKNTNLDFSTSDKSIFRLIKEINSREMKGVIDTIIQFIGNFDKERKALSK